MALRITLLSLALSLTLPLAASAQLFGASGAFSLTLSPQNPAPFGKVTLTPLSSQIDLPNSVMTVLVNGKQFYQGNARPTSLTLGAAGTLTAVKVLIVSNGKTYVQELGLRPQDVVLVAEPISSSPVLYRGKPKIPQEGTVRVVAVANMKGADGKTIEPSTLSYAWTVDATQIFKSSGIGKDTLLVASPLQYRARNVYLRIQSQDGSVVGSATLSIAPQDPTVRLYENDPLLGILFDRAITNTLNIASGEKSLFGAAFSFPTKNGAPSLRWLLNGSAAQTGNSITLRPTGTGAGSASLSLIGSSGNITTASTNLSLTFGEAKGGLGIFGL
jgi:hypothetical protein